MPAQDTIAFFRRNLPHWLVADRAYFVTLRLHGTLPRHVVDTMRQEREAILANGAQDTEIDDLRQKQFQRIEQILDGLKWVNEGLCDRKVGCMLLENIGKLCDNPLQRE